MIFKELRIACENWYSIVRLHRIERWKLALLHRGAGRFDPEKEEIMRGKKSVEPGFIPALVSLLGAISGLTLAIAKLLEVFK